MESSLFYTSANHADSLISSINNLRQHQHFCDIVLHLDNHEVTSAHRLVLCASSAYFASLLTQNGAKETRRDVFLPGFSGRGVKQLVEYFYTATIVVTEENVWELFPLAVTLQVEEVAQVCYDFLLARLQYSNAFKIYMVALKTNCDKLLHPSSELISSNFQKFLADEEFCPLPCSDLLKFLKSWLTPVLQKTSLEDDQGTIGACLDTDNAIQICRKWLLHDPESRQTSLQKILTTFPDWEEDLLKLLPKEMTRLSSLSLHLRSNSTASSMYTEGINDKKSNVTTRGNHYDRRATRVSRTGSAYEGIDEKTSTSEWRCMFCDKIFSSQSEVDTHMKTHRTARPLSKLEKQFQGIANLPATDKIDMSGDNRSSAKYSTLSLLQSFTPEQQTVNEGQPSQSPLSAGVKRDRNDNSSIMAGNSYWNSVGENSIDTKGDNSDWTSRDDNSLQGHSAVKGKSYLRMELENGAGSSSSSAASLDFKTVCPMNLSEAESFSAASKKLYVTAAPNANSLSQVLTVNDLSASRPDLLEQSLDHPSLKYSVSKPPTAALEEKGNSIKHVRDRLFNEPDLTCDICDKTYSSKSNLQIHKRTHSRERPYSCDQCLKTFSSVCVLRVHQRTHTGERPFHCPTCGVSFAKNIHLKRHLSIHTGEKPHECPFCKKRFSRSDHVKRHIQSIHSDIRPHVCGLCAKDFVRKYELNKHIKLHHSGLGLNDSGIAMDMSFSLADDSNEISQSNR